MILLRIGILLSAVFTTLTVLADEANYPELNDSDEISLMRTLSDFGLHDMKDERWNAYVQGTYISQWQPAFHAAYSNYHNTPNSLSNKADNSFTATVTPYLSLKGWSGGEFYAAPEMISELPLSNLKGLGGSIQNFELQKTGSESATWYLARSYYKHTVSLGGTSNQLKSAPLQLAGNEDSRRVVLTAGRLSVIDIFDKNIYSGDLRHQFFNMAFMANASYDFAADARGYTQGLAGEFYYDNWVFRLGRFAVPTVPNVLIMENNPFKLYGDQVELEHKHVINNHHGAIKLLAYRNRVNAGKFSDAITAYKADSEKNATTCPADNYGSLNSLAPDICWVRKANTKMGIGINIEQGIAEDIGVFFRGMYSDGKTEVYNYMSADQSISLGTDIKGAHWGREKDSAGLGYAQSWLSKDHATYLNRGGIDAFLGDGKINYSPERVVDIYYQCHAMKSVWLTADYQHLMNPGYNSDRGPVNIYGVRVHLEF